MSTINNIKVSGEYEVSFYQLLSFDYFQDVKKFIAQALFKSALIISPHSFLIRWMIHGVSEIQSQLGDSYTTTTDHL